jgi:hypothetical protein
LVSCSVADIEAYVAWLNQSQSRTSSFKTVSPEDLVHLKASISELLTAISSKGLSASFVKLCLECDCAHIAAPALTKLSVVDGLSEAEIRARLPVVRSIVGALATNEQFIGTVKAVLGQDNLGLSVMKLLLSRVNHKQIIGRDETGGILDALQLTGCPTLLSTE